MKDVGVYLEYAGVSSRTIWNTITHDLGALAAAVKQLKKEDADIA